MNFKQRLASYGKPLFFRAKSLFHPLSYRAVGELKFPSTLFKGWQVQDSVLVAHRNERNPPSKERRLISKPSLRTQPTSRPPPSSPLPVTHPTPSPPLPTANRLPPPQNTPTGKPGGGAIRFYESKTNCERDYWSSCSTDWGCWFAWASIA